MPHHNPDSHLLGSLPPVTPPTCGPDFDSHLNSRNWQMHGKTFHQVEFAMHALKHLFGGKVFQCVFLKTGTLSHCRFKLRPAYFKRFVVAIRMNCSVSLHPFLTRDRLQAAVRLKRWHLSRRDGSFTHVHITQHVSCAA